MTTETSRRTRLRLAGLAALLAAAAVAAGEPRPGARLDVVGVATQIEREQDHVGAPQLARWIHDRRPGLLLFDLRPDSDFQALHIPGAKVATLPALARAPLPRNGTIVLYSEGGAHAAQAWVLLRARGYRRVYFLREGLYEWVSRVLDPRLAVDATPAEARAFEAIEPLSRYFGGLPRRGVPRAEVPRGYWTAGAVGADTIAVPSARAAARRVRRRGC